MSKKKLSKRCSERRKTKTAITNARKEAKLRREMNKKKKNSVKIPRSELMTEEEKQHLKEIKEGCKLRSTDVKQPNTEDSEAFEKLKEFEKTCDCFIEVVDFRDLEGTRNQEFENFLKEKNHQVHVFINFLDPEFENNSSLNGLTPITNFSQFKNFNKICIFGSKKVGKFILSKNIEQHCGEKNFEILRFPLKSKGIPEVLRGLVDLKDIDPQVTLNLIWKFLEKEKLQEFFRLMRFEDCSSFLKVLSEKISKETYKKVTFDEAALRVIKAIREGQIKWIKMSDQIYFKFNK